MKISIRKIIYCLGVVFISNQLLAQSAITIEASQNITNFVFKDELGNKDDNYTANYSGGYALGYKYSFENGLFLTGKLGLRKAGASYVFDAINYSWDFHYSEVRLGFGYKYSFGKFGAHLGVQPYFGYLLKANQRINNEDFNILNLGVIDKIDYGLFISPGANFTVNEYISVYIDINTMFGLRDFEISDNQISNNRLYGANFGLSFTIK